MGDLKTAAFGNKRSPRQILIDALDNADSCKHIIVVMEDHDHAVSSGWSDAKATTRIGLLEIAKADILKQCMEDH